ncbi:AAA family ATPase [Sphingomonas endolithica]|uniref:AAA family ATPase n=1 Tax=Sphingomonas endolithica TaxID=2972485 RepID=UPI0021B06915|nr:AAA family ATPase [Sphingomonas sp. ZFBP2030]
MYDDHYGLSGRPFQLTPDPRFWFDTATHRKAMAYLGYGLSQGEGFIVITGDIGAGKTTLVGHLMETIDRERLHVIKIVSTQIEADDLLRLVAGGLDVEAGGLSKAQLLTMIERGLHAMARAGRRTLLIVDEAQALPVASLEELRMLSNFQASGHALLQIFLLGQPEFRERLHGSDRLEQLRQRVIAMHHLDPMGPEEVEPYMLHRLNVVGWQGNPHFTPDAYRAMYDGSDGVPRRLNQLAGRVMLFGSIEQLDVIDGDSVEAVIADIAGDVPMPRNAAAPSESPILVPMTASATVAEPIPEPDPAAIEPMREEKMAAAASVEPLRPLPIFHVPPPTEPLPIRSARQIDVPIVEARTMEPPANDLLIEELAEDPVIETVPVTALPEALAPETDPENDALAQRIALLEGRIEEQEAALRRVLTLLVDWVEGEAAPDAVSLRYAAAH